MTDAPSKDSAASRGKSMRDAHALSHRMLRYSSRGMQMVDFLHQVCRMLLDTSGADVVEMCMRDSESSPNWHARLGRELSFLVDILPPTEKSAAASPQESSGLSGVERLCDEYLSGRAELTEVIYTKNGELRGHRSGRQPAPSRRLGDARAGAPDSACAAGGSLILAPLAAAGRNIGVLGFISGTPDYFTEDDVEFCEDLAETLSVALVNRRAQAALRERVKELTCLYGMARLVEEPGASRDRVLNGIVKLLPPAWQYPEIAVARIVLDGKAYSTQGFRDTGQKQTADIVVNGDTRGVVEVVYLKEKPRRDEGPFLKEERNLIDAIARELALIVERDMAEEQKLQLQEQLWHSDRLATVGELAAGIAHELNEPLGSILGFAQLTMKRDDLPAEAVEDIEKVVSAALHAREVIRKLLVFSRQKSPSKTNVNLNRVIEDGLYFLSARCSAGGIKVLRNLDKDLPTITADPVQLHQALINLIINAIHAMPGGGTLKIETRGGKRNVTLVVEDNGTGMREDVISKVFLPFFTTKDVDQGTGLGLSVVHGIVTSHGGTITVDSEEGRGATFEIVLPVSGPANKETSG
jgi:two-component system NtrC family sensor kinase